MLICFFQQSFIQPGCSSTTCQACAKHHRPPATNKTGEVPSNREFSQSQTEMEATGQGNQERDAENLVNSWGHVTPAYTLYVCMCVYLPCTHKLIH